MQSTPQGDKTGVSFQLRNQFKRATSARGRLDQRLGITSMCWPGSWIYLADRERIYQGMQIAGLPEG